MKSEITQKVEPLKSTARFEVHEVEKFNATEEDKAWEFEYTYGANVVPDKYNNGNERGLTVVLDEPLKGFYSNSEVDGYIKLLQAIRDSGVLDKNE